MVEPQAELLEELTQEPPVEPQSPTEPIEPAEPPESTEPAEPPPPSVPSLEEQLQTEREERARLQGEIQALKEHMRAQQEPSHPGRTQPTAEDTPERIQSEYDAGRIDDAERTRRLARYETVRVIRETRAVEKEETTRQTVRKQLVAHMGKYPELHKADSPMMQEVNQELERLADLGFDPNEERQHLLAVERVIAKRTSAMSDREYGRRRIPVGGIGGGISTSEPPPPGGDKKSKGQKLFERMNQESKNFYLGYHNNHLPSIYKTLDYADEGKLTRGGRFAA